MVGVLLGIVVLKHVVRSPIGEVAEKETMLTGFVTRARKSRLKL